MILTIISITYNAEQFLERTIKSLLAQDFSALEYIIVDGNSSDSTLKIVEKYREILDSKYDFKIISEPDKGLYDAMNKGLKMATGDFVWYMNAGDQIADNQVVTKIFKQITEQIDVLYGETYFVDEQNKILGLRSDLTTHKLPKQLTWQDLRFGMLVCHQSFIVRRKIAPFYIENNLSADVDWEIQSLKNARKIEFLDFVVSKYLVGGISNKQLKRSLIDRFKVLAKHFGMGEAILIHFYIFLRGIGKILKNRGRYW